MSAFVHGSDHVDLLVSALHLWFREITWYVPEGTTDRVSRDWTGRPFRHPRDLTGTELGQLLIWENVRSVKNRYGDSVDDNEMGEYAALIANYVHRPVLGVDPLTVYVAASSMIYQSCEHEGWKESEACEILDGLQRAAIRHIAGYDAAASRGWCWTRSQKSVA